MNFLVNTTPNRLLPILKERAREEKSDYRSAREGGLLARCVLQLIVICVCLTQARRCNHPKSISSLLLLSLLSLSLIFLHHHRLKLYVLPEESIIHTLFFLFEYTYICMYNASHSSGHREGSSVNPTLLCNRITIYKAR